MKTDSRPVESCLRRQDAREVVGLSHVVVLQSSDKVGYEQRQQGYPEQDS